MDTSSHLIEFVCLSAYSVCPFVSPAPATPCVASPEPLLHSQQRLTRQHKSHGLFEGKVVVVKVMHHEGDDAVTDIESSSEAEVAERELGPTPRSTWCPLI